MATPSLQKKIATDLNGGRYSMVVKARPDCLEVVFCYLITILDMSESLSTILDMSGSLSATVSIATGRASWKLFHSVLF